MVLEYKVEVRGTDIILDKTDYRVSVNLDAGRGNVIISASAVTDFERLYRMDLRSAATLKL